MFATSELARTATKSVTLVVSLAASVIVGLLVFWAGTNIGHAEAAAWAIVPPPGAVGPLQIDPRDSAVANGPVTPYMERMASPDATVER